MYSKLKKPMSLVLIFVMALTITGIVPAQAADTQDKPYCKITIETPYQSYMNTWVEMDKEDLTDDFGLGLPTDGSDGYSGIRVLCKAMMRNICGYEDAKGTPNYTEADRAKARAEMSKYIGYKDGFLTGISVDGTTMNIGTAKDGKIDQGGYWGVYLDETYADVGLGTFDITKKQLLNGKETDVNRISLLWSGASYDADAYGCYGHMAYDYYYIFKGDAMYNSDAKQTSTLQVVKDLYKWDASIGTYGGSVISATVPVSGASVSLNTDEGKTVVTTLTADGNGEFTLSDDLKAGEYEIYATEDALSADGSYTYSKITRVTGSLSVIDAPTAISNVKASVTKSSGKKSTVKITWKWGKGYDRYLDSCQVYTATKKNGKYKKAGSTVSGKKTTIKLKKGTYYIKLQGVRGLDIGGENALESIYGYGDFTKPVKINVK